MTGFTIELGDPPAALRKKIAALEERLDGALVIKRKGKSRRYYVSCETKELGSAWPDCNAARVRILLERFFKGEA